MQSWKQTFILIKIWFVLNATGVTAIGAITIGTDGAKSRECFAGVWIFHIYWFSFQKMSQEICDEARCKIPLASQWYHNNHFISFSNPFPQQYCPGPRKTVGWTPILNAPTRTSTSRSTKTGLIQRFWVTRPSLTSSSATTVEANIIVSRNNLNFKITS